MGKRRVGPGQSALPKSGGPRESPEGSGKRRAVLALVLLVVAAFAACVAGISNGLVQDDEAILLADNRLQDFTGWREILTLPYWPPPSLPDQYRPVTSFFLAFQNVIGSGEPAMFRIVSYLLYAAASVAVFRLALRFFPFAIALSVALLFAAHPVHVEATALAVAQSEILVAILIVAAVGLYVARRSSPAGILRSRDWGLIAALYVIAAFIKAVNPFSSFVLTCAPRLSHRAAASTSPFSAESKRNPFIRASCSGVCPTPGIPNRRNNPPKMNLIMTSPNAQRPTPNAQPCRIFETKWW